MTSDTKLLGAQLTEPGVNLTAEVYQAVKLELEAICNNTQFRSSSRNCAFLRYVVSETLAGRAAEIKERTLGMELFRRPVTYDTGSDAVVRVRANEVRKRLACYYEEHKSESGWRIQMPLRSYVPQFLPEPKLDTSKTVPAGSEIVAGPTAVRDPLTLSQMIMPTLIALFLCAATFRWQIFSGTPYLDFWDSLLSGHSAIALVLDADPADPHAVFTGDLKVINPLLQTAATLRMPVQVSTSADLKLDRTQVVPIYVTYRPLSGLAMPVKGLQGADLTVVPGKQPELWIAGTNTAAIELAIHLLSSTSAFPQALEMALRRKTPTRFRIADGQLMTVHNTVSGGELWPH